MLMLMNEDDSDYCHDEDDCDDDFDDDYDGDNEEEEDEENASCYNSDERISWFLFLISMYNSLNGRNTEPQFQFLCT